MIDAFTLNWTTQLRKGILELGILNAVGSRPMYGYQIGHTLRGVDGLVVAEGTIYPLLNRLKREALVTTTIEESPDGPPRKVYQLTELGQERLDWMNDHWGRLKSGIDSLRKETAS